MDMNELLQQAMEMQRQLAEAQQQAATEVHVGQAGGGMVRIECTGAGEFLSVRIDPKVVDASDVDMLCDLVLAALHDVSARLAQAQQEATSEAMSGIDLGALGLGGLGGGGLGGSGLGGGGLGGGSLGPGA